VVFEIIVKPVALNVVIPTNAAVEFDVAVIENILVKAVPVTDEKVCAPVMVLTDINPHCVNRPFGSLEYPLAKSTEPTFEEPMVTVFVETDSVLPNATAPEILAVPVTWSLAFGAVLPNPTFPLNETVLENTTLPVKALPAAATFEYIVELPTNKDTELTIILAPTFTPRDVKFAELVLLEIKIVVELTTELTVEFEDIETPVLEITIVRSAYVTLCISPGLVTLASVISMLVPP
jgi:hypothetical protein